MATIIEGNASTYDSLLYEPPHPSTIEFVNNSMAQGMVNMVNAAPAFFEGAKAIYDNFASSEAVERMISVKRAVSNVWSDDIVRELKTIDEMQWAKPTMRRYIMTCPEIHDMYVDDQLEGYYKAYKDPFIGDRGEAHYDYRRVTNGLMLPDGNGDYVATTYIEELIPGDRELMLEEQADILATWANVLNKVETGREDPTSRWNASI